MKNSSSKLIVTFLAIIFLGVFGWAKSSMAAPAISGISGTISHGQTINISGVSFGTKLTAAPVLWDAVENQSAYNGLSDGAEIPVGGSNPWGNNSDDGWSNDKVRYETIDAQRGVSTAMYKSSANASGFLGGKDTGGNKIYLSWWQKIDTTLQVISRKMLRVSDPADLTNKTASWTDQQLMIYDQGCYNQNTWRGYPMQANQWYFREIYIDSSAKTIDAWADGSNILVSDSWASCPNANINYIWKLGYDEPHSYAYPTTWMDDIYVDNTPQRVMVCSGSTWTAKSHCEMQIPSAWSVSSITAKVNRGSFGVADNTYLYVVDSAGSVNSNGYPITFGSGASPDTTSPAAPTGLAVN